MIFVWNADVETGEAAIDKQHKELVNKYNRLYSMCTTKTVKFDMDHMNAEISKALGFLCSYTAKHFADEEALQIKCGYPDYERHKQLHEAFKQRAVQMSEVFKKTGFTDQFANIVYSQIGIWLIEHIQKEDTRIAECIKSHR